MTARASVDQTRDLLDWVDGLDLSPMRRECMITLVERADYRMRATVTVAQMAEAWDVKTKTAYGRLRDMAHAALLAWAPYEEDAARGVSSASRRRWVLLMHPSTPWAQHRDQREVERSVFFAMAPELFRRRRARMEARMDALQRGELQLADPSQNNQVPAPRYITPQERWAQWVQP
ncbi:hypothetical protein SZMC14600_18944 [Saccharomonospora azurea SZMC 14600]|uniref:hypothetical protein n=1 Tax=Saccharomonospora azurea TaxID=40988 RepID=UPI00023FF10A|nr:hypothetical protein [Saccharomonospora azurea]EHK83644.1 hypothetical protein SZMC14600_18944 [Saccharomonospora azurea SZMC 14600]